MTDKDKATQEAERIAAADEYFKARTWLMDTTDNRRIFEAGFDRAYALLSKLRAPVALPAGYALVPIEPTPEMIEAGATERITPHASAGHGAVAGYKAMLAAAPVASAPVADERAAFEAARQKRDADARLGRMCLVNNDEYSNSEDQAAWEGWQDRAALASAPVAGKAQQLAEALREWHGKGDGITTTIPDELAQALYGYLYAAPQASEAVRLRRIAWLIGSIFVHGDFKAETGNERELEKLLRENGTFWDSLEQFDAALSAQPGAQSTGGSDE